MTITTRTTGQPLDLGLRGKDLFDRIRATIDANPQLWDQSTWATRPDSTVSSDEFTDEVPPSPAVPAPCGTAYCVAGWACALSGHRAAFYPGDTETTRLADGEIISTRAAELLGLDEQRAGWLFASTNDLSDLDEIAAEIWGEQA